jgi:alpha-L-glutamate ligase-like protein
VSFPYGQWLNRAKVLGMNRRNADYIMRLNSRSSYPLVDNKVLTKKLAAQYEVPTPALYYVVENHGDVRQLGKKLAGYDEFVIKPARGSGGSGIILITGKTKNGFVTKSEEEISEVDLIYNVSDILSGIYSLGGLEDHAIVEALIHPSPVFAAITYRGVPDIRVITYRGVPAMTMVRLPTKASGGKANLHQGAIGVGIDINSGVTLSAVHSTRLITHHPDTGKPVNGIEVPYWGEMLLIAARSFDMTGLGYLGVDLVIDKETGPVLLELNARPGLAIQMANGAGLWGRLECIDKAPVDIFASPESRVAWAQENL